MQQEMFHYIVRRNGARLIGCLEIATGVGIAIFWVLFFTARLAPANPPVCYFQFEHAFPLPDGLLTASLVAAGSLLANGKPSGRVLSLPVGGALMFLGAIDVSFDSVNGLYSGDVFEALQNGAIDAWCFGFGLVIVVIFSQSLVRETATAAPEANRRWPIN
jgi:hypothetical protein